MTTVIGNQKEYSFCLCSYCYPLIGFIIPNFKLGYFMVFLLDIIEEIVYMLNN